MKSCSYFDTQYPGDNFKENRKKRFAVKILRPSVSESLIAWLHQGASFHSEYLFIGLFCETRSKFVMEVRN